MPPLEPIARHSAGPSRPVARPRRDLRGLLVVGAVAAAVCGAIVMFQGNSEGAPRTLAQAQAAEPASAAAPAAPVTATADSTVSADQAASNPAAAESGVGTDASATPAGIVDAEPGSAGAAVKNSVGCEMTERSVSFDDSNSTVRCIQDALIQQNLLTAPATGTYDNDTVAAVRKLQVDHDLFVDGLAGRETGLQLGIWPDEASLVVHTPAAAPGAKDSMGFTLSPVASTGADAPALPENSGTGRRLVYSRAGQRIWAMDKDGNIIRSWLISGSKFGNETTGVHKVFSRSETTTAWNGRAILPLMVRWLPTKLGAIGFHAIPIHVEDGSVYQTDAELGTRLSGGCQRQNNLDAQFTWAFAQIGTPVVVV